MVAAANIEMLVWIIHGIIQEGHFTTSHSIVSVMVIQRQTID